MSSQLLLGEVITFLSPFVFDVQRRNPSPVNRMHFERAIFFEDSRENLTLLSDQLVYDPNHHQSVALDGIEHLVKVLVGLLYHGCLVVLKENVLEVRDTDVVDDQESGEVDEERDQNDDKDLEQNASLIPWLAETLAHASTAVKFELALQRLLAILEFLKEENRVRPGTASRLERPDSDVGWEPVAHQGVLSYQVFSLLDCFDVGQVLVEPVGI